MSTTSLARAARSAGASTSYSVSRKAAAAPQLLKQLARFNPNQLSSYAGVKLLLPVQGRRTMLPQGSAAARKPVQMSFLGVGAPEAILVAVVALVVFGPKGLADAARSVGSALRTFQPTIKEVVQVSQELKGTLESELGINELREAARPQPRPLSEATGVSDTMAKVMDPEIEAKRAASAQAAWGAAPAATEVPATLTAPVAPAAAPAAAAAVTTAAAASAPAAAAAPLKDLSAMSMEELEAELARRRASSEKRA